MKVSVLHILTACLVTLAFICCQRNQGNDGAIKDHTTAGGIVKMQTYRLGRFSIDIPSCMKKKGRSHRLRLTELDELVWDKKKETGSLRSAIWDAKVMEIKKANTTDKRNAPIIEQRQLAGLGLWARGIFYQEKWALDNEGVWEVLVDYGPNAVWFKTDRALTDKDNVAKMVQNFSDLAKGYRPLTNSSSLELGDWFYLENGAINLPYKWEEQTYASFEGHPLELELEVAMTETYTEEPEEEGLFARTAAAIATGYAMGVDIKKIRSRHRIVAGMKGEEQVVKMKDKDGTEFDFTWRYAGKKGSGEFPKVLISMESPDGNIDEKLKVWDAVLDSMKPLYKTFP